MSTIATASKSQINEEAGTHVHFEIRKDNVALIQLNLLINKSQLFKQKWILLMRKFNLSQAKESKKIQVLMEKKRRVLMQKKNQVLK